MILPGFIFSAAAGPNSTHYRQITGQAMPYWYDILDGGTGTKPEDASRDNVNRRL
jgi:hypothetical protein